MTSTRTIPTEQGASAEPDRAFAPSASSPSVSPVPASIPSAVRVLDACCGSRMFWFDRQNPVGLFLDKRSERHLLPDVSSAGGLRELVIAPDIEADFTALPFPDEAFALVVLDPPHLVSAGRRSWLAKKYGVLGRDWREELRLGFAECFRVLKADGTLIFKWNEAQIPLREVLALTPVSPLFGNRGGKAFKSHWLVFMKPDPKGCAR